MNEQDMSGDSYAFGHTQDEIRRVPLQVRMALNPFTRRLLAQAGIVSGVKTLDVGSGAGDVTLLLAERVGPSGTVVGVESNPAMLEAARARVDDAGLSNVTFLLGDIDSLQLDDEFDAIVGRLILTHLRSPAAVLQKLADHLRPGGIVAFQEFDLARLETLPAHPPCQLTEQACHWIIEVASRAGLPLRMGLVLYTTFLMRDCRRHSWGAMER